MLRATLPALAAALVLTGAAAAISTVAAGDAQVAAVQHALQTKGVYAGPVDGFARPSTTEAIRRFQTRAGLVPDGRLGTRTRKALDLVRLGTRPLGLGATGSDVFELQFLLAWHGFPSATMEGQFNDHVDRALRLFQAWAGIRADGISGTSTLAAFRRALPISPLRLAWPLSGAVGDGYGPRGTRFHAGIDIAASTGAPVAAAGRGTVTWAGPLGNWGLLVVVDHASGVQTFYAHLSRVAVTAGQRVTAGTRVGLVGATGDATGPHLHFEVRVRGAAVDPLTALS